MKPTLFLAAVLAAATAQAQDTRVAPLPRSALRLLEDQNAARIGVYLGESNMRDTAGVLINSVVKDGPADKAGIKEGDRVVAIDGVNLRMSRDDAEDPAMRGMMSRRLTRELDKHKPGDEVELRLSSGGNTRTVRVKTVAARDLDVLSSTKSESNRTTFGSDRAAIGVNLGGSPSRRDTLGVFVTSVNPDGPAEKAGIVEGDRIARINGTDLRVQGPEAGDADMSRALISRFNREIGKLKAGDDVTLTVVSGGRSREVKLNAVRASELHGTTSFFFRGDGFDFEMPALERLKELRPGVWTFPDGKNGVRAFSFPEGNGAFYYNGPDVKIRADVKEQVEKAMEKAREAIEKARPTMKSLKDEDRIRIKAPVKVRTVTI